MKTILFLLALTIPSLSFAECQGYKDKADETFENMRAIGTKATYIASRGEDSTDKMLAYLSSVLEEEQKKYRYYQNSYKMCVIGHAVAEMKREGRI